VLTANIFDEPLLNVISLAKQQQDIVSHVELTVKIPVHTCEWTVIKQVVNISIIVQDIVICSQDITILVKNNKWYHLKITDAIFLFKLGKKSNLEIIFSLNKNFSFNEC
jgi:hypothetical protein